jgi:hypothetical protein
VSFWIALGLAVLWAVSWWHGWYVGRRAGFDEVLRDFAQQELDLEDIKRRTAERWRDA